MPQKKHNLTLILWIARRYLFSQKSHNAINIISAISAMGVAIGTMALITVLSVFNGFEQLFEQLFSSFDPDIKISLVEGKSFDTAEGKIAKLSEKEYIEYYTKVVEENALIRFGDKQIPGVIKGVSADFALMTGIQDIIYDGVFKLKENEFMYAVLGYGLAVNLGINPYLIDPLVIYAPKRDRHINTLRPENSFNQKASMIAGIFQVNQPKYDNTFVIVDKSVADELFEYSPQQATSLELKIKDGYDKDKVQKEIQILIGDSYKVQNRYEQQEDFFRITQIEKWLTYLILSFILLIAIFNIIGSLSMLIIEKQNDILILRNLGANDKMIKRIFLLEGWLIAIFGAVIGIAIGTAICLIQQHLGIIKLGEGYIVENYPIFYKITDVVVVFLTVSTMGLLAALYPVKYINIKNIENK